MNEKQNYLFLFTIGPVQGFIAQARKTQDLAAGSKLLSDLVLEAIRWLNEKEIITSDDLIFPKLGEITQYPKSNLPNRFLAEIPNLSAEELNKHASALKKAIEDKFKQDAIYEVISALEKAEDAPLSNELKTTIETQISNTLEVYWAAVPFSGENAEYKVTHTELERLLAGTKNARLFNQQVEKGRKCSVDGVNNVVVYREKKEQDTPWWLDKTEPRPLVLKLNRHRSHLSAKEVNKGEGISAVTYYKRVYEKDYWAKLRTHSFDKDLKLTNFPSTVEVATRNTLEQVSHNNDELKEKLQLLFESDEQFLFEENLSSKRLDAYTKDKRTELKQAQSKLVEVAKGQKLKISPYYAILLFDADKMGKFISGTNLNDTGRTMEFQKKLSKRLIAFAKYARDYVDGKLEKTEEHEDDKRVKGSTVYAGGDDFLGFINLDYLFEVLMHLREEFKNQVYRDIKEDVHADKEFTFSAGVVIAHYKTPLNAVLEQAHASEQIAKSETGGDRNALCLTVMKHSGEVNQTVSKWHHDKKFVLSNLQWLVNHFRENELSKKFFQNLATEFKPMADKSGKIKEVPAFFLQEFQRLIKNSCINESIKNEAAQIAANLFHAYLDTNTDELKFTDLVHALGIAEFIQRNVNPIKETNNE